MLSRRGLLAVGLSPTPALLAGPGDTRAQGIDPSIAFAANAAALAASKPSAAVMGITLAGYRTPMDGGGAQYRRGSSEPAHPGKIRSADGSWWELCEPRPTPEMFGANGSYETDTPALQACCDYVRLNYPGTGLGNQAKVYLTGRSYFVNRSIDFTDNGVRPGLGIIGVYGTSKILGLLTTPPYPIVDMSGVFEAHLEGVEISSASTADQSAACLIIANVVGMTHHANNTVMRNCVFNHSSANSVGALLLGGDDLVVLDTVYANCHPPGQACGFRHGELPASYFGHCAAGSSTTSARLDVTPAPYGYGDPGGLGPGVAGKLAIIFGGKASGSIIRITDYNAGSQTISWSGALPVAPDATSRIVILAVDSAYRTLNNVLDNTSAHYVNCIFAGANGAECAVAVGSCTFDRCYITSVIPSHKAVANVLVSSYVFPGNGVRLQLKNNCRFENEGQNADLVGVMSWTGLFHIDFDVDVGINTPGGFQAVFGTARGGVIGDIDLQGGSFGCALLDLRDGAGNPASIASLTGHCGMPGQGLQLGTVKSIGWVDVSNWENPSRDNAAVLAAVAAGGRVDGVPIIPKSHGYRAGVTASNASMCFPRVSLNAVAVIRPTSGLGAPQTRFEWIVPPNVLDSPERGVGRLKLRFVAYGGAAAAISNLQLQFAQSGAVIGRLPGGPLMAGNAWKWQVDLDVHATSLSFGAELWNGTSMAYLGQGSMTPFDPELELDILMLETAAHANAAGLTLAVVELG
jgi:hypothetical protein